MRRAVLFGAALAAVALAAPGVAASFNLPRADVAATVAPDGSLLVSETITLNPYIEL